MVVEAREGAIGEWINMVKINRTNNKFPLFAHEEISAAIALLDRVDLFGAARIDAIDTYNDAKCQ